MNSRRLALMIVPALGLLLTLAVIASRARSGGARAGASHREPHRSTASHSGPYVPAPRPGSLPKPASPEAVGKVAEDVRVRGTYDNYRTAIATGNDELARSLRPAIIRHRTSALRWAEEELAQAQDPFDQGVARRVADSLRDKP